MQFPVVENDLQTEFEFTLDDVGRAILSPEPDKDQIDPPIAQLSMVSMSILLQLIHNVYEVSMTTI